MTSIVKSHQGNGVKKQKEKIQLSVSIGIFGDHLHEIYMYSLVSNG